MKFIALRTEPTFKDVFEAAQSDLGRVLRERIST